MSQDLTSGILASLSTPWSGQIILVQQDGKRKKSLQ